MNPSDLLDTSKLLLASGRGKPPAASLRRAVSSTYYAMFHHLARECANLLIGGAGSERSEQAWRQVYRSLEHGAAKEKCRNQNMVSRFPKEIVDFANMFVTMQEKRHDADYDPFKSFTKSSAMSDKAAVEVVLQKFRSAKAKDRRAFCAYVLLRERKS